MVLKVVTFKIDGRTLEKLEEYASKRNMYRSEVIRNAIEYYLRMKEIEDSVVDTGRMRVWNLYVDVGNAEEKYNNVKYDTLRDYFKKIYGVDYNPRRMLDTSIVVDNGLADRVEV